MTEDSLRMAREREHIVSAMVRAQGDWRTVLEVVEASASAEDAQEALTVTFGFTRVQAVAVLDVQFSRISRSDRERMVAELSQLRREVEELGGDTM